MIAVGPCLRCWLFIALGSATTSVLAAPALRDYLRACGIGDGDFARFADDRQTADEELDVVRRIAVRLRDCPADAFRRLMAADGDTSRAAAMVPLPAAAKEHRGRAARLRGRVEAIEPAAETLATAAEPLWRCALASADPPHRAIVYVSELSKNFQSAAGEQIAVDAVFVKYVPGERDAPVPVFAAGRLQRRGDGPLGDLDFDLALLDGIRDNAPLTPGDSDAFYRLLALTGTAAAARLRNEANVLDAPAAARLFHDPASERCHVFRVSGVARRAVRVSVDDPATAARLGADHYFQIDLLADSLQGNPLVFCTLELPPGMPLGGPPDYSQPVEVTGVFLKLCQYPTGLTADERAEHPAASRAMQAAPLLVGPPPQWQPPPVSKKRSFDWLLGGIVVLAMTGLGLLLLHLRQSDQEFSLRNQL